MQFDSQCDALEAKLEQLKLSAERTAGGAATSGLKSEIEEVMKAGPDAVSLILHVQERVF